VDVVAGTPMEEKGRLEMGEVMMTIWGETENRWDLR
jgi:hypothetical protein